MKKGLIFSILSALSIAFIIVASPPQASAAQTGFYDIGTNKKFTSVSDFKKLSKAEKKALFRSSSVYVAYGTKVNSALDVIMLNNVELATKAISVDKFQTDKTVNLDEIVNSVELEVVGIE